MVPLFDDWARSARAVELETFMRGDSPLMKEIRAAVAARATETLVKLGKPQFGDGYEQGPVRALAFVLSALVRGEDVWSGDPDQGWGPRGPPDGPGGADQERCVVLCGRANLVPA